MTDQPATETLGFHLMVIAENGLTVPIHVVATYPEGEGYYAVKALENINDKTGNLYRELIRRKDMTTLMVMASIRGIEED